MKEVHRKILYSGLIAAAVIVLVLTGFFARRNMARTGRGPDARPVSATTPDLDPAVKNRLLGKVTLIEFGAVGCALSQEGLEAMIGMQTDDDIEGLSYLRVESAVDQSGVDEYYGNLAPGFPVHQDPEMKMAGAFGATTIPTFVLVDRFGHVRYRGGLPPEEHLSAWVDALNAEKTDPGRDVPLFGAVELDIPGLLTTTELPVFGSHTRKKLDEYMGKNGLLVVFVDARCPYAAQIIGEMPDSVPMLADQGISSVLVTVNSSEEDVRNAFGDIAMSAPMLYDVSSDTHLNWNIFGVPRFFLIGPDRKLIYHGVALWQEMASGAERSLGLAGGALKLPHAGTEYG